MKRFIWILICCVWISTCSAIEDGEKIAITTLPDGITIELVGLRNYGTQDLESFKNRDWPWWKPDGTALDNPPDMSKGRTTNRNAYWFVIRINGIKECTLKAVGQLDSDLTVQPVQNKGQVFEKDDLRSFTLKFFPDQKQADIQLGLAADEWEVVESWPFWENAAPDNSFFSSSDGVIMRCPEQKGSDVVAEITQTILDDATKLVIFDKEGGRHTSIKREGGSGAGLIRYIHRFKYLDINNIQHIEFQKRSYNFWITFYNVSLSSEHKTNVEVKVEQVGSLLSKQLPEMKNFKIDLSSVELKDKKMLICFFNYEQRPSRNCILQLSKRAQELKAKDIVILAVQASKIEQSKLNEWIKENNISFPVGIIQGDVEKTRFAWGMQSLPWLILTDKKHIVQAEGFGINELDEKIITLRKK